ncbi:MAG: exodeoxyribonuclease VII large subunit [Opitutales bacterium TMED158]|nr:MAG: exodeoxyribonuclease VII large subunit [Opitutales bacterium TMED158]
MKDSFLDQFGEEEALSVSRFTRAIKRLLEGSLEPCWIKGEVSNFRRQASGHLYFSLKDESAQLPVVMFRGNAASLEFELDNGAEVSLYGEVSVYEPHGRYQLIARAAIQSGQGKLHREFERLKRRLLEEGLFDKDRKQALPKMPRRIAFITSPTGAAAQDFIRILKRREWTGHLAIIPVKVQGVGAADSLLGALELARTIGFDAIAIGRGGGSLEDLWCFNDERLARAISASETPIISAVGHEIDFTLSDFAADVRAETPSAAAELISSSYIDCVSRVEWAQDGMEAAWDGRMGESKRILREWRQRIRSLSPERRIESAKLRMDEVASRIDATITRHLGHARRRWQLSKGVFDSFRPDGRIASGRERLRALRSKGERCVDARLATLQSRLIKLSAQLNAIGPQATLKRGYAILSDPGDKTLASVEAVSGTPRVKATLSDGEVWLTPKDV